MRMPWTVLVALQASLLLLVRRHRRLCWLPSAFAQGKLAIVQSMAIVLGELSGVLLCQLSLLGCSVTSALGFCLHKRQDQALWAAAQ
jgi:hypothetical protein